MICAATEEISLCNPSNNLPRLNPTAAPLSVGSDPATIVHTRVLALHRDIRPAYEVEGQTAGAKRHGFVAYHPHPTPERAARRRRKAFALAADPLNMLDIQSAHRARVVGGRDGSCPRSPLRSKGGFSCCSPTIFTTARKQLGGIRARTHRGSLAGPDRTRRLTQSGLAGTRELAEFGGTLDRETIRLRVRES